MRKTDSHLDFDLDLAKEHSDKNPVYYVQYAHARICSILKFAEERGFDVSDVEGKADPSLLDSDEEVRLLTTLIDFPDLLEGCAVSMEVHRLTNYMEKLASDFHYFYTRGIREPDYRVVSDDKSMTMSRLLLMKITRTVLHNALRLAGVSAPEKM
jgi:arginyl-tRNA synthetase